MLEALSFRGCPRRAYRGSDYALRRPPAGRVPAGWPSSGKI